MTTAQTIAFIRHLTGFTQRELASRIGIFHPTIARMESGRAPVTPLQRARLETAFGIRLDDPRILSAIALLEDALGHTQPN